MCHLQRTLTHWFPIFFDYDDRKWKAADTQGPSHLPVHNVGVCLMAHWSRVDSPVAVWQLSVLNCVVSNWGQAIAAWFPRQQDSASLDLLLRHYRTTRRLGSGWREHTHAHTLTLPQLNIQAHFLYKHGVFILTSLFCRDHQSLSSLAPALSRLSRKAKHVNQFWFQSGRCVLTRTRTQHIHSGRITVWRVSSVCNLVG